MNNFKKSFVFIVILLIIFIGFNHERAEAVSCLNLPTVSHGGKIYDTVQVGTQCWLKQNLDIGLRVASGQTQTNNGIIEKYCYDNLDTNCNIYGGLYQWAEAVGYLNGTTNTSNWSPVPAGNVRGICPVGWHVPTLQEVESMWAYLGGGNFAGGALKQTGTSYWRSPNVGATNSSDFSALPNGHVYLGNFANKSEYGNLWTRTSGQNPATDVHYYGTAYNYAARTQGQGYKTTGYAVRCLKDSSTSSTASVSITASAGSSGGVLLNATPVNGGTSPTYQWKKNGVNISGATLQTYTYSPANGDSLSVVMTSNLPNVIGSPATSNTISAPAQVTGLTATAGNGQVTLNWTAPVNNGGSPITTYAIRYKLNSATSWTNFPNPSSTATSKVITGLTNGSLYNFAVKAVNLMNTATGGTLSSSVSATPVAPATAPGAPTNLTGIFSLFGTSANLSWTAPANNGGSLITSYKVEYKLVSANTWLSTTSATTSKTITGLTIGGSYDYRVSAINGVGTSPSISITAPSQVTGLIATAGNGQVTLSWTAPASGGSPLTNYVINYKLNSASTWSSIIIPATSTTKTITGLTNGSNYSFIVRAWGSSAGAWSNITSKTPTAPASASSIPSAPINLTGIFNGPSLSVNLSWMAPVNNGNSSISGYIIEYKKTSDPTWTSTTSTTTSKTITGLLSGVLYEYRVSAINAIGTGPSVSITAPSKVTGLIATPGNGQVILNWTIPYNGGAPLNHFRIRYKKTSDPDSSSIVLIVNSPYATSTIVTGLMNNISYDFKVRAWGASPGAWSDTVSKTPIASIPPTNLIAGVVGINTDNQNINIPIKIEDTFTANLSYGKTHQDVKRLQQFLNSKGYNVVQSGNETSYFGTKTKQALIKFQKDNDIAPAIGNLGPLTRSLINQIINGGM